MFIGEYQLTIDDKGRAPVPARFRASFADGAVVTRGLDRSLFLYTKSQWAEMAAKIAALPLTSQSARNFSRLMLAGAVEVDLDRQGRFILPGYLREFAALDKAVTFAGVGDRVEIWDAPTWAAYQEQLLDSQESIDNLENLGI